MDTEVWVHPPGLKTIPSVPSVLASWILSIAAPSWLLVPCQQTDWVAAIASPLEEVHNCSFSLSLCLASILDILQGLMAVD